MEQLRALAGASFRGGWGYGPQGFLITIFPCKLYLIKRKTLLLLKEQYVTVGLVGQAMLFANIS